jgi:Bacterial PH domain
VSTQTGRNWAPKIELVVLALLLAAGAASWALFGADPPGRVLMGAVALLLALAALNGLLVRPRLTADSEGVTVRGLTGSRSWRWAEVNVRLVRNRRFGREVATLELDAENSEVPALVVLGRLELGTDPEDVVDALLALRT